MTVLGFLLDGNRRFLPALPVQLASYFAPIVTLVCCVLIARNQQWLPYAVGAAMAFAALLIVPLFRIAVNIYDDAYSPEELIQFWFLVVFPFAAIAIFLRATKSQNKSVETTRGIQP